MTANPQIKARCRCSAFTLLELLVSSAIIGLMMVVLLTTASTSLGLWRGAEARIAVDREGRNGLALMADDLANMAVLPAPAPQPVFLSDTNSGTDGVFMEFAVLRPLDYQDPTGAMNSGDVCYVRYKYNGAEKKISRSHVDSAATFAGIKAGSAPPAATYEMLAANVIDFAVNTYDTNGASTTIQTNIASVSLSMGVAERQEVENLSKGITMPDSKTTKQYFSINASVPKRL